MTEPTPPGPALEIARRPDGDLRVGTFPAGPAGLAAVSLPGATAYVDPTSVGQPPCVVVSDEAEAAPVLELVFGAEVAERALGVGEDGAVPVEAGLPTGAADRLCRYGRLRWLAATGPLPLDRALLALETLVAADDCDELLDPADQPAVRLPRLAPLTVALARGLRARGDDAAWPGLPDLLDRALAATLRRMRLDDPAAEPVRHEAELRQALARWGTGPLDWDRWAQLLRAARPEAATHAGVEEVVEAPVAGQDSVDWALVPPGVLDTAEGTVVWHAVPHGDRSSVSVEVAARPAGDALEFLVAGDSPGPGLAGLAGLVGLPGDSAAEGLRWRVYLDGFGLPLGEGELRLDDAARVWRGAVDLPRELAGGGRLSVQVFGAAHRRPPRRGAARVAAEAMRWAARATASLRLFAARPDGTEAEAAAAAQGVVATGAVGAVEDVRAPLERARQLYLTVATGEGEDARLARRQATRCDALLVGHLESAGNPQAARRRRRSLTEAAPSVARPDLVVPDFHDPAWRPTVSELALLHRPPTDPRRVQP